MTSPFPQPTPATIAPVEPVVSAPSEPQRFERAGAISDRLVDNIETVVYGKRDEIKLVLTALACDGHVLLEDVPGTAKTVLARAIAGSIDGAIPQRIQCTPDLQPTDVTGLSVFDQRTRSFEFRPGPIFANVVLVDEINRATPKTQSALLEAMAERQVTVDGVTRELPYPFLLLATENPIEYEGTFPLPEAQLDRFFLRTALGYPEIEDELRDPGRAALRASAGEPRPVVGLDEVQRAARGCPARVRRRRAPPLGGRARPGDARAGVRRHRQLGPREPRARAGGSRMGAPRRPKLRRPRGHRAPLRPGARAPRRLHAGLRRACSRHRMGGGDRGVPPSCLEVAPRPGSGGGSVLRGSLAPAAERASTCPCRARRSRSCPAAGSSGSRSGRCEVFAEGPATDVAGSRPYRPGDDMDAIDWAASARLSTARGSDEFVVRERFAEEAPKVVIVCDRRPADVAVRRPVAVAGQAERDADRHRADPRQRGCGRWLRRLSRLRRRRARTGGRRRASES